MTQKGILPKVKVKAYLEVKMYAPYSFIKSTLKLYEWKVYTFVIFAPIKENIMCARNKSTNIIIITAFLKV